MKKCHTLMVLIYACIFSIVTATAGQASSVTLQWTPETDPSVTGYKVYYNADSATLPFIGTGAAQGASPINVANLTSPTVSGLDPSHAYYFAVTAYNASGTESPYSGIVNVAETIPPTVSITSPLPNASISGTVSVAASATDNVGVTKVEFYLNGTLMGSDTSAPYVYSLNAASLAPGTYTLMAKAYDVAGNIGTSGNVSVTVASDTIAPTVSLTAPVNNAILSGTTTITANASDNVGVTKVEFYGNGVLLYATNVAPFSYSWNTTSVANGSYTLSAKAYDNVGNVGQSANAIISVNNQIADTKAPTVSLSTPANNAVVSGAISITANATDNVGVSKVDFYVNGALKSTATAVPYTYSWNTTSVANGSYTLSAKASDAAGNIGQSATVTVSVNNPVVSAGSIWAATTVPGVVDAGPDSAVELGVRFRSDSAGYITGVRFYKAGTNTGTHIGNLWDNSGKLLASATFTSETASGWQTVNFATPVAISANTVYMASYHANTGHYSFDQKYFSGKGVDTPPLHALADGTSGYSGAYTYGSTSSFPSKGWNSTNYWVDVAFTTSPVADTTPPTVAISSPTASATVSGTVSVNATASDNVGVSKVEFYVNGVLQATDAASPYNFSWNTASVVNGVYNLTVKAYDAAGNNSTSSTVAVTVSNSATTSATYSIWSATAVPSIVDAGPDNSAVELGVKFRSDLQGYITGIRFYKASTNTGTHVANLWTSTGTRLATATFAAETASGWQQVNFATPVAITANTVYIASYHTNVGHYSDDQSFFTTKGVDNAPLHALANGVSGANSVYAYSTSSAFPNQSYLSSNYWVDVVFKQ